MKANEIFTPNRYPDYTYVARNEKKLESKLQQGLRTPGEVVSLSGPSKSGKTVLVQNVVDQDSLIIVQGSSIESSEDLWNEVLDEIGVPVSTESHSTYSGEAGGSFKTGLKGLLPGVSAKAEAKGQMKLSGESGKSKHYDRGGLRQVVEDIKNDEYVILVDDFHYISREGQKNIAEVIKEAARQDISMCVALVPHRSDDLVRANSDLRGRVRGINVDYWNSSDLEKISSKGYNLLN